MFWMTCYILIVLLKQQINCQLSIMISAIYKYVFKYEIQLKYVLLIYLTWSMFFFQKYVSCFKHLCYIFIIFVFSCPSYVYIHILFFLLVIFDRCNFLMSCHIQQFQDTWLLFIIIFLILNILIMCRWDHNL